MLVVELLGRREELRGANADEHAEQVRIRARDARHDRGVRDDKVPGPPNAAALVDDARGVDPHPAGPARVRVARDVRPDPAPYLGRRASSLPRIRLLGERGKSRRDRPRDLDTREKRILAPPAPPPEQAKADPGLAPPPIAPAPRKERHPEPET